MKASRGRALLALLGSCAALAIAAPAANASLEWDSASHDFGSTNVGTPAPAKTFTLTATCEAMSIAGLCGTPPGGIHNFGTPTVSGTGFAIQPPNVCLSGQLLTITFPSSNTCQTTVTFTPAAAGAAIGSLDLPAGPDIALSGTGVAPTATPANPAKSKKCKKRKGKGRAAAAAKKKKCKKKK